MTDGARPAGSLASKGAHARPLTPLEDFLATPLDTLLARHRDHAPERMALILAQRAIKRVPAYRARLIAQGIDLTFPERLPFDALPPLSKDEYYRQHPLPSLCWDGRLDGADTIALSSGSTGEPAVWPRTADHEAAVAARFEQVFRDGFRAAERSTLAVVCFALGTWVGGMYTTACCRLLARKGYRITVATPGNHPLEIAKVLASLGAHFDQIVLLGYPPFLRDVLEGLPGLGVSLPEGRVRLVVAGECISEAWRTLVSARLKADPLRDIASIYGTADAGVLAVETPLAAAIRRWLALEPVACEALLGSRRLPTLCQYDPVTRYLEEQGGELLVSADGGVPLLRYRILDRGGILPFLRMRAQLASLGCGIDFDDPALAPVRDLPFVWVFGRTHIAVSMDGANIYPEHVAPALERPPFDRQLSGKFVLSVIADAEERPHLALTIELLPGQGEDGALREAVAAAVAAQLVAVNSEFAQYVPAARRRPRVVLRAWHDPEHFGVGVKHRYVR